MAISIYNLKRWSRMLTGNSIYHVNQNIGRVYSVDQLAGYYNDLTEKVINGDSYLEDDLPFLEHSDGSHIQFPTAIFQYGLGAYDLWLLSKRKNDDYYRKFCHCAEWAYTHQQENGAWNNFYYIYPDHLYSAMPQGEGASLVLRMYKECDDKKWLDCAKKAIDFMLIPVEEGGTAELTENSLVLLEYTNQPVVLNGWIFAVFGIFDYLRFSTDVKYKDAIDKTIQTMLQMLPKFDCGYWSMYDLSGRITSPFYHNLHIAQMKAMYALTGMGRFNEYALRWKKDQNNLWKKSKAFVKKSLQKILER